MKPGRGGTLMRHLVFRLTALAINALPIGVIQSAFRAALVSRHGFLQLNFPRDLKAKSPTIALAPITMAANHDLAATVPAQKLAR